MSRLMAAADRASGWRPEWLSLQAFADSARNVFDAWRRNLPEGWWVSLACAFMAGFYIVVGRIVFGGFA